MTKATTALDKTARSIRRLLWPGLTWVWLVALTGCITPPFNLGKKTETPTPSDSVVLAGGADGDKKSPADAKVYADLDSANLYMKENKLQEAEKIFAKLANNTKNPMPVVEEARYNEAECQRQRKDYRSAEATYKRLLKDFSNGKYAERANEKLFEIANFWLDDTRKEMEAYEKNKDNKWTLPTIGPLLHFSREKPLMDQEGHAVQCLEDVHLHDINGPLGEKALFYLATVKFFRRDYRDADECYTQLYQKYPNSELAPKAIKQAIICKQVVNGGSAYNGRIVEEARKLVTVAGNSYPELAHKEADWLERQLISINTQQADRDFNTAEFYRRTGHPGAAYFYYELVRRSYQGTGYAEKAAQRMVEIRAKVEKEHAKLAKAEEKMRDTPPSSQGGFWSRMLPASWQRRASDQPEQPAATPSLAPTGPGLSSLPGAQSR